MVLDILALGALVFGVFQGLKKGFFCFCSFFSVSINWDYGGFEIFECCKGFFTT